MAKIVLINPSYLHTYGANHAGIANPVYPILSLAALAGVGKARGHTVRILDLSYRAYDPVFLKNYIREEKPDVVGITATTPLVNQMRDMSFLIKEVSKDILTVGGGSHPSSLPQETMMESLLDVVAVGEADDTFGELIDGHALKSIRGIYWRNGGEIVANPLRPLIPYLDALPMPAWELYPLDEYRKRVGNLIAKYWPLTTLEFSRGCVFQCDFCGSKNTMGLGYRKKSPERCADEMAYLEKIGFREALLTDDIFTSDNHWAVEVCTAITKRKLKMAWTCTNGIRVDSANEELFRAMKTAGCYRVHFGFESGNDAVLKAFGKGGHASLKEGQRAVRTARAAGLETWGMFMVGLSADTEATMNDTIGFAKAVDVDVKKLGITVPFPGTPMFRDLLRVGKIKTLNWDDYNVYNEATQIYDHPTLSWKVIKSYYRKAYLDIYYKSPTYIAHRLLRGIRTGEFFWDLYFAVKFFLLLISRPTVQEKENYAYRDRWEKLNISRENVGNYTHQKATTSTWKANDPVAAGSQSASA